MKSRGAALALLLSTHAAHAASTPPQLDEVIVTARRTPEKASHLPLAIDVAEESAMGPGAVDGLDALAARFPGLAFESMWGGSNSAPMLRGLVQPSAAGDNVGVFVDDVYQAGRAAIDVDLLDLERIEIVRGPQNTQFGRSTFAGAIRYVPAKPTAAPVYSLQMDLGSDSFSAVRGAWSQRIGHSAWLGRIASGYRSSDGTWRSTAGESLGATRHAAVSLTIARDPGDDADSPLSLNLRLDDARFSHPPSATIGAADFNCGAFDPASAYWSFYCGRIPMQQQVSISPGLPDSRTRTLQAALHAARSIGGLTLRSLSSWYHDTATSYRDFDGGMDGFWLGVCTVGVNCPPNSRGLPVTRFTWPNIVARPGESVTDWSQEFRIGTNRADKVNWMLGLAGSMTRTLDSNSFGVDRGDLLPTERLTSIIASDPARAGLQSPLNAALVEDSRREQLLRVETADRTRDLAAFGMVDVPVSSVSHARLELRAEKSRQLTDSRYAGFAPDTSPDPPAVSFREVTPRISVDLSPHEHWYGYVSLARGARSGGINTGAQLDADERRFDPEYNLTTEMSVRYSGRSWIQQAQVTAYHVDWRNAQIVGLATTPGVNYLITKNTAGIISRGFEAQLRMRAGSWLAASLAWSHSDARFMAGSDDPGSRVQCGLTALQPSSDLCAYGPPRTPNGSNIALVAYLDGNRTARNPLNSWNLSLELRPRQFAGNWIVSAQASLAMQGDVFEQPINGARFGARELLSARALLRNGAWQLGIWGSNLTDERYIRTDASRGGNFYPTFPRPLDLLYGERRRLGVSVSLDVRGL
jgi:iron complex outermembrane receptor protein